MPRSQPETDRATTRLEDPAVARGVVLLAAWQLALHVLFAGASRDPRLLLPHAVAWLHDLVLLGAVGLVLQGALRLCPARARPYGSIAARLLLLAPALLLALYPAMLQSFLAAPASFLQADAATARLFVRDYLGVRALWPAAVTLGIGLLAPRAGWLHLDRRWAYAAIPLAVLTLVTLGRDSPNPVVFALQDQVREQWAPRSVPRLRLTAAPPATPTPTNDTDWSAAARGARYDHVLVIVLEGVTAADFEAGLRTRAGGFMERHRHRARYFSRYHATNLDSYTALVAMTTSVQVPFRAYAAPEWYAAVNDAPNVARGLRAAGFRALFISTYEHQPFVPNRRDWDRVVDRRDLGDLSAWVSLGANRMEAATEDRAALPTLLGFVRSAPRSLVMAELVYGHAPAWRVRTGLEPVAYYDRYLTELEDGLRRAQVAERTLLVVVSDHGQRARAAVPDNYRVPLFVVGDGVAPGEDAELRSHLDLQAIVAHFLLGTALPRPRSAVQVIGSTERWIYGEIRQGGDHVFIDDGAGRVLAGTLAPAEAAAAFQRYVGAFLGAFGAVAR